MYIVGGEGRVRLEIGGEGVASVGRERVLASYFTLCVKILSASAFHPVKSKW